MTNNSAMWADVNVNGNTFRVFNAHLETTGISGTMHRAAKLQMQGMNVESNRLLQAFYGNYTLGMIARAGQANVLAMKMRESKHPVIVCGDFNDVPYSYVYNTMLGEDKVDGFVECGSGFMNTFRGKKPVRIDYIFHDKNYEGIAYYKKELSYSDHYPVFMKIALK
jgi:endonuclease/exonuclease/phosphatase family metal-dependent hydrolase